MLYLGCIYNEVLTVFTACVNDYFNDAEVLVTKDNESEDPAYKGYKAVLDSKSIDESLVSSLYLLEIKLLGIIVHFPFSFFFWWV